MWEPAGHSENNVFNGIDTGLILERKAHFRYLSVKGDSAECCSSNDILNAYVFLNICIDFFYSRHYF
jgi:hypothetical protein